jgi:hypothetical protein
LSCRARKRILAGGVLAFTFEGSEQLMANLQEAAVQSPSSGPSAPSVKKPLIADDTLREMAPLFTSTWLSDVLPKALGLSRPAEPWLMVACPPPSLDPDSCDKALGQARAWDMAAASRVYH